MIDCPEHRALARRAATESVVLLKNDGLLPLNPERAPRTAVIGPHADTLYEDWYSGTLPYQVGIATGLSAALGQGSGEVVCVQGADRIELRSCNTGEPLGGTAFDVQEWGDGVLTLCDAATGRYLSLQDDASLVAGRTLLKTWFINETFRLELAPDGEGDTARKPRSSS
jgi:beta-glucosidase